MLGPFIMGCAGSWDKSMMSITFQLSRGLCLTCTSNFEAAAFLVLHASKGRERRASFNRAFTPVNVTLRCFFPRALGWASGGSLPSLFPKPLHCTLGKNSSWSRSCPSLTMSACDYTKASGSVFSRLNSPSLLSISPSLPAAFLPLFLLSCSGQCV